MNLKKKLAAVAAAATLLIPALATPAQAQDPAQQLRQSAEPVAQGSFDLYQSLFDNPVTAPSAIGIFLSSMTWHYLIWCPVATQLGSAGTDMGRCSF
jgi:hypothetical protein